MKNYFQGKTSSDYVILCGQDHVYWIYDEAKDKYYRTEYRWAYMSEEDMMARVNEDGIDGRRWVKELND